MELKRETIRPYEGVIIMMTDAAEEAQKSLFKKNKQIIESFKGKMHNVDSWGRRKLANPIEKEKTGLYFHYTFAADPQCVAELERTMRINESVLRFINVRLEDDTNLDKHLETFKQTLADSHAKEKERELKKKQRASAPPAY
jgi:small subunit ribosomal protein S6